MNRILLLILFVFSYCVGSSQAISQRGTSAVTVQDARLFAQYNFRPPVFSDTIQANLQIGLDSCGALIFSRDINSYYLRACNPKRWVTVSGGGSGNAWNIGGNASPSSPNIGTTTATEFNTITNGIARTKIKGSGIARRSAARNKYLMIDTTDKYLYYGDAISSAGLQQVLNNGETSYNKSIFLFDSTIQSGYKGIWLSSNNGYQSSGTEVFVSGVYNNTGIAIEGGANTSSSVRPKVRFMNDSDDNPIFLTCPPDIQGATYNLPWDSPNGTGEDTLATLQDVRNVSGSTIDTTSLSNRINSKLSISDTSSMLSTYLRSIDTTSKFVNRLTRTPGKDSIIYFVGGNRFAIKDSIGSGTVTSVGLTMPSAFNVTNSPITTNGTIAVTGSGTVSQYVRGDGTLANFPNSTGGGASVNYYLNGSISQGTFGGDTYYQMSKTPILGAGTSFTRTNGAGNGYIASFITDANDPSQLNIPGGNWNLEFYFQSSASGGTPQFYGEVYKVSATNVFTLVASGSANPEGITNGTAVDQYFTSISVPQTTLLITDRLAIRIYVITGGRTITLHTENSNLCEVLTTFTTGLTALNGLTAQVQSLGVGTTGTDFNIVSSGSSHTFNLPTASATNRGALSTSNWTTFNNKLNPSDTISLSDRINQKTTNLDLLQLLSYGIKAELYGVTLANVTSQLALVTNRLFLYPFNWNVSDTLRGISWFNRAAFTNTATNYNGIAIYSLSGGTLTRVMFTANDGTFWNGTINSWTTRSVPSTFLTKGIYFLGYQYSGSLSNPTIASPPPLTIASTQSISDPPNTSIVNPNGVKFSTFIANITSTPPTSIAMSTTTAVIGIPYFLFY